MDTTYSYYIILALTVTEATLQMNLALCYRY